MEKDAFNKNNSSSEYQSQSQIKNNSPSSNISSMNNHNNMNNNSATGNNSNSMYRSYNGLRNDQQTADDKAAASAAKAPTESYLDFNKRNTTNKDNYTKLASQKKSTILNNYGGFLGMIHTKADSPETSRKQNRYGAVGSLDQGIKSRFQAVPSPKVSRAKAESSAAVSGRRGSGGGLIPSVFNRDSSEPARPRSRFGSDQPGQKPLQATTANKSRASASSKSSASPKSKLREKTREKHQPKSHQEFEELLTSLCSDLLSSGEDEISILSDGISSIDDLMSYCSNSKQSYCSYLASQKTRTPSAVDSGRGGKSRRDRDKRLKDRKSPGLNSKIST